VERIIPFDSADYLEPGGPPMRYRQPSMTLSDGTVMDLTAPGPFTATEGEATQSE
jgi:hypothetical protein